jgi:hypothetical protein
MAEAFVVPPIRCCVEKVFGFNHKTIINVQESPPTRNLWSTRV